MLPIVTTMNDVDFVTLRDAVLTAPVFGGKFGDFPWDRWEQFASKVGVSPELCAMGRRVFREAFQHDWSDALKIECGWLDGGVMMIFQALAFPELTAARWSYLYSADNFGSEPSADAVTRDPVELAEALEAKGIKTVYFA